jgi:hypothetical protein
MIPEKCIPVELLGPSADAGGRTGDYISLKNAVKAYVVFHILQGNAATVACDVTQATAVVGTGVKALAKNTGIWSNLDCAASSALVRRTDAAGTYTTDAGVKHKIIVFEIDLGHLDLANSFDCIGCTTGASNAANITSVMAYVVPKYTGVDQDFTVD